MDDYDKIIAGVLLFLLLVLASYTALVAVSLLYWQVGLVWLTGTVVVKLKYPERAWGDATLWPLWLVFQCLPQ